MSERERRRQRATDEQGSGICSTRFFAVAPRREGGGGRGRRMVAPWRQWVRHLGRQVVLVDRLTPSVPSIQVLLPPPETRCRGLAERFSDMMKALSCPVCNSCNSSNNSVKRVQQTSCNLPRTSVVNCNRQCSMHDFDTAFEELKRTRAHDREGARERARRRRFADAGTGCLRSNPLIIRRPTNYCVAIL